MKLRPSVAIAVLLLLSLCATASSAGEPPRSHQQQCDAAIGRALPLIEASSAEYLRQRQCFSCHHQALPVLTLSEARRQGMPIDEENYERQLQRISEHLRRGRKNYLEGRGQGGQADTAGYGLLALAAGGAAADEVTTAVVDYLLARHADEQHWRVTSQRPPSEASDFTTTYLALCGLKHFAGDEQAQRAATRRQQTLKWLSGVEATDTEDRVFRLRSLHILDAEPSLLVAAAQELIGAQRDDGGWGQTADLESDAYATGTALVALYETDQLTPASSAYQRGVQFLLDTQLGDGSWHVVTRSKPIQQYFESGFPHGEDQFISMAATCWATLALLHARDEP